MVSGRSSRRNGSLARQGPPAAKRQRYAGIDVKAEAAVAQAIVKVERASVVTVERSIIDEFQRTAVADNVVATNDSDECSWCSGGCATMFRRADRSSFSDCVGKNLLA